VRLKTDNNGYHTDDQQLDKIVPRIYIHVQEEEEAENMTMGIWRQV
jgi:hypothetical protein